MSLIDRSIFLKVKVPTLYRRLVSWLVLSCGKTCWKNGKDHSKDFKIILKKRILRATDEKVVNFFKFFWPVSKSMGPSGVSDGLLCLKMKEKDQNHCRLLPREFLGYQRNWQGESAFRAGIFKKSMGARHRVGIGLSYRPARLHRLAELMPWNRYLGSINV